MKFYILHPEEIGEVTSPLVANGSEWPPSISELEVLVHGWLGDDLVSSFPAFMTTERLAKYLKDSTLTGFDLDIAEVKMSEEYQEFFERVTLPGFLWLKVLGQGGHDDIGSLPGKQLIVSQRVLDLFYLFQLTHCDIKEFHAGSI